METTIAQLIFVPLRDSAPHRLRAIEHCDARRIPCRCSARRLALVSTLPWSSVRDPPLNAVTRRPVAAFVNGSTLFLLTLDAYWRLCFYDALCVLGVDKAYRFVRRCRRSRRSPHADVVANVVWAVDEACVWYGKRVYCLQRSAICTWLLRRQGIAAELVIGYRPVPVDSHAWVEVDGTVVNDRPQYQKFFRVLDRL